jgi:hypothetical protein
MIHAVGSAYSPADWAGFAAAQLGASAALAGLVFVGVSINLDRIMRLKHLPDRALEALILLTSILFSSSLVLVPGQSTVVLGGELLVLALVLWALVSLLHRHTLRVMDPTYRAPSLLHIVMSQAAAVTYVVSGASLALHAGGGLYWLVPATVLALATSLLSAWVLLVEVMR